MTTITDEPTAAALFRAPPHALIDVGDGAAVAHRVVGAGPDVLFVHGWPMSGATFHRLLPYLAPHLRCHVVDLVGAGDSRFDRTTRIDPDLHVRSIRRVVDALDLDQYAVVGHDSGGLLARHAVAGDDRLRAVGLMGTEQPDAITWWLRAFLLAGRVPGFEHALAWVSGRPVLRANTLVLGEAFRDRSLLGGTFDELGLAPLRDDPDRRWAAGQLIRRFDTALIEQLAAVHARIAAPVQLVWGADDPFFPVERARAMLDTFPDAQLAVVPDAKLFVHEERPAEVAAALLPTLRGDRTNRG